MPALSIWCEFTGTSRECRQRPLSTSHFSNFPIIAIVGVSLSESVNELRDRRKVLRVSCGDDRAI